MASPLDALHMKTLDSCKIQVINQHLAELPTLAFPLNG
jgi:hypothetical protein